MREHDFTQSDSCDSRQEALCLTDEAGLEAQEADEAAERAECAIFEGMSDAQIVSLAAEDSAALEYLLNKYKHVVRTKARSYFLVGADREDLVQEGMIGLYKAIRDYKSEKQASFRSFAELCITRQIITAIKTATRQKHKPLNSYVSLSKPVYDEESDRTVLDVVMAARDNGVNPEEIMIDKEEYQNMEDKIKKMLSGLEREVLDLYLAGKTYQQIAQILQKPPKSIDNALQRVKNKLGKYMVEKKTK